VLANRIPRHPADNLCTQLKTMHCSITDAKGDNKRPTPFATTTVSNYDPVETTDQQVVMVTPEWRYWSDAIVQVNYISMTTMTHTYSSNWRTRGGKTHLSTLIVICRI